MKILKFVIRFFKSLGHLFMAAGKGFIEDKVTKLSASLAYYTIFALTPLIIIVISAASLFFGDELNPDTQLFAEINSLIGETATLQLQSFVINANLSGKSTMGLIIGVVTLVIGATAIFIEIQDSINLIWKVKAIPKKGWMKMLTNRLLSFSLIISMGFLLLVSLVINSIIVGLGTKIERYIPEVTTIMMDLATRAVTIAVVTGIFAIIFKVLPDVILKWKTALIGALFTALLFSLGQFLIGIYIEKGNPGSAFGAAGSVIIILLWIYYSAIILYFGAEFTQAYAEKYDEGIRPSKYAVHTKIVIVEKEVAVLPPQHPEETKVPVDE
ncbi:YihY/virulence factor BrkB family protein [Pedobacter sp.]|uniref:YihY/virulence factor BrkB family protein n=1 Tax=Pedobacter sp. TaxID=1411316 RepID=UPI003D7F5D38